MRKFILKVGSQYTDGFQDTSIVRNDFDFEFDFARIGTGIFEVPQFDKTKHFLEFQSTYSNATVVYGEDNVLSTNLGHIPNDNVFEFGGFITITEFITEQYTNAQLSTILQAKSLLIAEGLTSEANSF